MVVTTSPLVKTYTLQEFWELPELPDGSKLELIKGVLYMTPPPDYPNNQSAADLHDQLGEALKKCGYRGQIFFGCGSFRTKYFRGFLKTGLVFRSATLDASRHRRRNYVSQNSRLRYDNQVGYLPGHGRSGDVARRHGRETNRCPLVRSRQKRRLQARRYSPIRSPPENRDPCGYPLWIGLAAIWESRSTGETEPLPAFK